MDPWGDFFLICLVTFHGMEGISGVFGTLWDILDQMREIPAEKYGNIMIVYWIDQQKTAIL